MRKLLRTLGIALAVGLVLSLLASWHYYIARRLVLDPGWTEPWATLGVVAIGALFLTLFLQPLAERTIGRPTSLWVAVPASLWMGFGFLFLVTLGGVELLAWLGGGVAQAATGLDADSEGAARLRALAVVAVAGGAGAAGMLRAWRGPDLVRIEVPLARWPKALDGFRIVQISDVHIGPILDRRFSRHVVDRCNALDADLCCVTGDLVDGGVRQVGPEVEPFGELRARLGVWFVTGNHDHYSNADDWVARVEELGWTALRNRHEVLDCNGARFALVGVDDHRGGHFDGQREDLPAALEGLDPALPRVLMAHDPSTFPAAAEAGVDLQLSGHTHGGQIWPFRYLVRLATPFVAGRYRRGGSELYVSRGTGFWGPPMRLGAPAEITEITLRSA